MEWCRDMCGMFSPVEQLEWDLKGEPCEILLRPAEHVSWTIRAWEAKLGG